MSCCSAVEGKLLGSRGPSTPGSLQRSQSDIDVNAASSAKSRLSTAPASSPFSRAAALPPGSYASLGKLSIYSFSLPSALASHYALARPVQMLSGDH